MSSTHSQKVQIRIELCKRCGICIELCPQQVFGTDDIGTPQLDCPEKCSQCLNCELHCLEYAIEVQRPEE